MNYLQDADGNTIPIPDEVYLFKGIVSFFDFTIKGEYSTDFQIPNDSQTRRILGYHGINQAIQVTEVVFGFYVMGEQVSYGRLFIRKVGSTFDVFFIAGNANWINRITGSIKDLDFSRYDVRLTSPNVDALKSTTEGIIFPVCDWAYNYKKLTNAFLLRPILGVSQNVFSDMYPCFHIKTIFEKIFSDLNITLQGTLLSDPIYRSIVISPAEVISTAYTSAISGPNGQVESMSVNRPGFDDQDITGFAKVVMDTGTSKFNNALDRLVMIADYTAVITYSSQFKIPETGTIYLHINGISVDSVAYTNALSVNGSYTVTGNAGDYVELFMESPTSTDVAKANVTMTFQNTTVTIPTIYSSDILPQVNKIDFVKYVVARFACLLEFDEISQVLTVTKLDSVSVTDAVDLSDDIIDYEEIPSSGHGSRNYLRTSESDELINYKVNNLAFGDYVIDSDGEEEETIIRTPFQPSETFTNFNLNWLITNIPLIVLEDSGLGLEVVPSDSGGNARFTLSDPSLMATNHNHYVFRIEGDLYNGFFTVQSHTVATGLLITHGNIPYTGLTNHIIYPQKIVFNKAGSRELIVVRNAEINSINTGSTIYGNSNIKLVDLNGTYPQLTQAWAYFAKPTIGTAIDNYKINLNYGPVINVSSFSFRQFYHQGLEKVITAPRVMATFLFSQTEYKSLLLRNLIYLKTQDFEGYFLILNIDGYKNPFTPVRLELKLWQ